MSPDGTTLAYPVPVYNTAGQPTTEIWMYSLATSAKKRVGYVAGFWDAAWYDTNHPTAMRWDKTNLYVFPLEGTKLTTLSLGVRFSWAQPAISPDSNWVAFPAFKKDATTPAKTPGVFALDVRTNKVKTLSDDTVLSWVDWSPDSKQIVYGCNKDKEPYKLKIVNLADGKVTNLGLEGTGARWSPDGKWIAYTGNSVKKENWQIGIPLDGSILKVDPLTKKTTALTDPGVNKLDNSTIERNTSGDICPVWSPDGKKIAYRHIHQVLIGKTVTHSDDQLWVMDSDGTNKHLVTAKWSPYAWSKDSKSLYLKEETNISRIDLATSKTTTIASWPEPKIVPAATTQQPAKRTPARPAANPRARARRTLFP